VSAIVGGLIGIERQLLRIAKVLEEKNKLLTDESVPAAARG
jgi:hypothetical protein